MNDLLVKNYEVFQQNYKDSNTGTTPKRRRLASRNAGFAVGRAEWYISEHEGCKLLLADYLATKSYGREEFFQPNYFVTDMREFLKIVENTIISVEQRSA